MENAELLLIFASADPASQIQRLDGLGEPWGASLQQTLLSIQLVSAEANWDRVQASLNAAANVVPRPQLLQTLTVYKTLRDEVKLAVNSVCGALAPMIGRILADEMARLQNANLALASILHPRLGSAAAGRALSLDLVRQVSGFVGFTAGTPLLEWQSRVEHKDYTPPNPLLGW